MNVAARFLTKHERGLYASWLGLSLIPLFIASYTAESFCLMLFLGMTALSFLWLAWRFWGWLALDRQWHQEHDAKLQTMFASIETEWKAPAVNWQTITYQATTDMGEEGKTYAESTADYAAHLDD